MPHKRPKYSERVADKVRRGKDLAPSSDFHFQSMPKGAMRILNGANIQEEYREKKRRREDEQASKLKKGVIGSTILQIREGEKMSDFNRRVESSMAKGIQSSIRGTNESSKKRKKKDSISADEDKLASVSMVASSKGNKSNAREVDGKILKREREVLQGKTAAPIEFQKAETRRRFNDVVLAPPTLTKAPRGQTKEAKQRKAALHVLMTGKEAGESQSSYQARLPEPIRKNGGLKREAMLQQERDRVVQAYRQKKGKLI